MSDRPRFAAIIIAGGRGSRMGGIDKAELTVGDQTLLERSLAATRRAVQTVVVADPRPTTRPVTWTRESPAGGGPAAALYAGLDTLGTLPLVAVSAVDMPNITSETLERLAEAVEPSADGALLEDDAGFRQPLCAVYRVDALLRVRPDRVRNLSMKAVLARLQIRPVRALYGEAHDVDTWGDLAEPTAPVSATPAVTRRSR